MTASEIEAEVQARVAFKMNELLTAVTNMANASWHQAFNSGHGKYANYWEAYNLMLARFKKELNLPTPSDHMAMDLKQKNKREAIDKIMEELVSFGRIHPRDEVRVRNFLARTIEALQN